MSRSPRSRRCCRKSGPIVPGSSTLRVADLHDLWASGYKAAVTALEAKRRASWRILDVEQGSAQWIVARLGLPTAFVLAHPDAAHARRPRRPNATQGTARRAHHRPTGERRQHEVHGARQGDGGAGRRVLRASARRGPWRVGFVTRDDGLVGCSPDRFVGDYALRSSARRPLSTPGALGGVTDEYRAQAGALDHRAPVVRPALTSTPMPPVLTRMERHPEFIAALSQAVGSFAERLADGATDSPRPVARLRRGSWNRTPRGSYERWRIFEDKGHVRVRHR